MLTSQKSAPPMMPSTSKGERGRPVGEPEAFSDYNLIYELMKKRGKKTEHKRHVRRNTETSAKAEMTALHDSLHCFLPTYTPGQYSTGHINSNNHTYLH